jgi:cytoskeletal protein RodZ
MAGERLRARRRRMTRIRKRVIAIAVVTFALLWGVIFIQLVSGQDPALSQKSAAVTSTTSTSSGSGTTSSASGATGSTTPSSGAGTTSPITTSQS